MPKYNGLLFHLLSSLLFMLCSAISQAQDVTEIQPLDSLSLHLHFDTTEFLYGQNIIAYVSLVNHTDRTIDVADIRLNMQELSLLNRKGESLIQQDVYISRGFGQRKYLLAAGDSLVAPHYLCKFRRPDYVKRDGTDCLTIGETQVQAGYRNQFFSPFITIRINQPTGDESLAYEIFRRIPQFATRRDWMRPLAMIDSLIESYPQSKYVPEACKSGLLTAKLGDDSTRITSYCTILVHSNPNHDYAISGFDNILTVMPPSSIYQFCDSIAAAYPNTRVGARALEKLASLKVEKQ